MDITQFFREYPQAWGVLGTIVGWGLTQITTVVSNRRADAKAAQERKDRLAAEEAARIERESIRAHEDTKSSALVEHANAQNWREIRLQAVDDFVSAVGRFSDAFQECKPDHRDDDKHLRLAKALDDCRAAGLSIELRSTPNVVRLGRNFITYLNDVTFDAFRWKDLKHQPPAPPYGEFTGFTALHQFHDTQSILSNNLNAFIQGCRQELGIIEYQLPEMKSARTGPTFGTIEEEDEQPKGL